MEVNNDGFSNNCWQFIVAVPVLLVAFQVGAHLNWASPASKRYVDGSEAIVITENQASWMGNLVNFGSMIGIVVVIFFCQNISRKLMMYFSVLPMFISWTIIYFAKDFTALISARIIAGLGMCAAAAVIPVYLGEIATDRCRGALTTLYPFFLSAVSPVVEYFIVPLCGTQLSALINGVLCLVAVLLLFFIPESPYFLIIKGKPQNADKSLRILRNGSISKEMNKIVQTVDCQMVSKISFVNFFKSLKFRNNQSSMIIMVVLFTLHTTCGTNIMLNYTHIILEKVQADVSTDVMAFWLTIIPIVPLFLSTALIDSYGVKPFLILSTLGCVITFCILGGFFHLDALGYNVSNYKIVPIISLMVYKFIHAIGIAGVPFKLLSEIFSTEIKTTAVCLIKFFIFVAFFVSVIIFQFLEEKFGLYVSFYSFGVCSFLGIFFIAYYVPETKRMSLYEVQLRLGAKYEDKNEKEVTKF